MVAFCRQPQLQCRRHAPPTAFRRPCLGPSSAAARSLPPLQVLKQKRLYESQRDQLYNQQFNVEQTSFAMTSMQVGLP